MRFHSKIIDLNEKKKIQIGNFCNNNKLSFEATNFCFVFHELMQYFILNVLIIIIR